MKKIAVFGSTGSIGTQALDVIQKSDKFCADVIVAHSNLDLLINQARMFKPRAIGLLDESAYDRSKLGTLGGVEFVAGKEAYSLCESSDEILFCVVGCDALSALMHFVRRGKVIALANKECLVSAGALIMKEAANSGAKIIPVDSEHSAVWQCLRAGKAEDVREIILTASGGRYYNYPVEKLRSVTPAQAVIHPNWKMGKKISVDSATMMNKALEMIEAYHLFGTKNISYIIHPESIIHSMVRFNDGAIMAQLSCPDMRLPISVALAYPDRIANGVEHFSFDRALTFLAPREDVFFAPTLARQVIARGGSSGAVLDGANEGAVSLFMNGEITFDRIAEIVRDTLYEAEIIDDFTLDDIISIHAQTKEKILRNNF